MARSKAWHRIVLASKEQDCNLIHLNSGLMDHLYLFFSMAFCKYPFYVPLKLIFINAATAPSF